MKKRQFLGIAFPGILHQKAQRVDMGATRGIVFDRPERWIVNTPVGQQEISQGDWLVELQPARFYVIKDADIAAFLTKPSKKWWKLWQHQ